MRTLRLALAAATLLSFGAFLSAQSVNERVDARTGVKLRFAADVAAFPEQWYTVDSKTTAEALTGKDIDVAAAKITRELRRYPVAFIKNNLSVVYVFSKLGFFDAEYGSTNDPGSKRVYLTHQPWHPAKFLEASLHSEIAGLLIFNRPPKFTVKDWAPLNSRDFIYNEGAYEAIVAKNDSTDYSSAAHAKGYLHTFGMSAPDSDFKSYVEGLFTNDPKFWAAVAKYPKVRVKAKAAIAYYNRLNPIFTEKYFRSLK